MLRIPIRQCNHKKVIWISWEKHRRTIELNRAINSELFILNARLPRILRYFFYTFYSFFIISHIRPSVLIIQNPSIVLSILASILKRFFGYSLVVDTHNAGLDSPIDKFSAIFEAIIAYIQRTSEITIVTNNALAERVRANGGNPFVLPDRLPQLPKFASAKQMMLGKGINIAYICTYANDEPWKEVIKSAAIVGDRITIYVTGNYQRSSRDFKDSIPGNVIFTGYLSDQDYWNLIHTTDIVMDLTLREDCMVCGAYEAVAAGKPLILSDTSVLRDYFSKGALFCLNDSHSIANAIVTASDRLEILGKEVDELRDLITASWREEFRKLEGQLGILSSRQSISATNQNPNQEANAIDLTSPRRKPGFRNP